MILLVVICSITLLLRLITDVIMWFEHTCKSSFYYIGISMAHFQSIDRVPLFHDDNTEYTIISPITPDHPGRTVSS